MISLCKNVDFVELQYRKERVHPSQYSSVPNDIFQYVYGFLLFI